MEKFNTELILAIIFDKSCKGDFDFRGERTIRSERTSDADGAERGNI